MRMPCGPYVLLGKRSKCKSLAIFPAGPANKTEPRPSPIAGPSLFLEAPCSAAPSVVLEMESGWGIAGILSLQSAYRLALRKAPPHRGEGRGSWKPTRNGRSPGFEDGPVRVGARLIASRAARDFDLDKNQNRAWSGLVDIFARPAE
jgi:hypothetical protein